MRLEQKIVEFWIEMPEQEVTIRRLSQELNESYSFVHRKVYQLALEGVLIKKSVGKSLLCRFNFTNEKARALLHLTEVDKAGEFLDKNREIKLLLTEFVEKTKGNAQFIALFGSWAQNKAIAESDIDLFILTTKKDDLSPLTKELNAKYGKEINILQLTFRELEQQRDKAIIQEILKKHIVLLGYEKFLETAWPQTQKTS